jgi:UDP-N-acetylmuramoyl-tripeptide--D-alanyl-D-alanine ligase
MQLDQQFILSVIPDAYFKTSATVLSPHCTIDSRTAQSGETFIALSGSRVDGHDFIAEAIERGVSGLVVQQDRVDVLAKLDQSLYEKMSVLVVPDTYQALYQLAAAWRAQFSYPVIGITGSVGKTSTKELLSHVLHKAGKHHFASHGNQNTRIGIALNALKMQSDHEFAIFEMGVGMRGQMDEIAQIARPTTGAITMIGHSHLEGLGSIYDVAAEKRAIFNYFRESDVGIINGDQALLATVAYRNPIIKCGFKTTNQVQARKVQVHGTKTYFLLKIYGRRHRVVLPTSHTGRLINTLACVSLAVHLGIDEDVIVDAIQDEQTVAGRYESIALKDGKGVLINDCYNASPESVKAALQAFHQLDTSGKKIAVLGDMLELGVNTRYWHRQLGRVLRNAPSVNRVIFVGDNVKSARETAPINISVDVVSHWQEAADAIKHEMDSETAILVKGSRALGLDGLVKQFAAKTI